MADYIDRQAIVSDFEWCKSQAIDKDRWQEAIDRINALPSADVQPVRHGRWLDGNRNQPCSVCKYRGKKSWNYCPNCGARMDGERKE